MKFSRLIAYLKYYWQFIPFQLNALLAASIVWLAFRCLHSTETDTNSFQGITMLMAKIAMAFSGLVIGLSLMSTCFCLFYFMYQKKRKGSDNFELTMDIESYQHDLLRIQTRLPFALKPILGFVKVRLVYDKTKMTDKYIVSDRIKNQFISFNTGLISKNTLLLPDIKAYSFSHAFIYFEDMLHFFSFAASFKTHHIICNLPHSLMMDTQALPPKKTDEEKVRIEQLRKVEGELLSYKKFEDSDDVRRIVWKIFAKNKELVVRVPEIMDPFASHIYLYASFFNTLQFSLYPDYQQVMLNRFKNCVWTIYNALSQQEFDVAYQHDQDITTPHQDIDKTRYTIACSAWHQTKTLSDYFKPQHGSALCIHSYTSPVELEQLIAEADPKTTIFFVQLSSVFKSNYILHWLLRLFVQPKTDHLSALRNKWAIHPLKFQTLNKEKVLLSLLKKSDLNTEII